MSRNKFLKRLSKLIWGNFFVVGLKFATLPLVTRLYGPEDYGKLAIFSTTAVFISIFASHQLEYAVLRKRGRASQVTFSLGMFFGPLLGFCGFVCASLLADYFKFLSFLKWDWNLLVYVWTLTWFQMANFKALEQQRYQLTSISKMMIAIPQVGLALWFGVKGMGLEGLLLSTAIGQTFGTLLLVFCNRAHLVLPSLGECIECLRDNRDFPLMTTSLQSSPIITDLLKSAFLYQSLGQASVGYLGLAQKLLKAPINLVINSSSDLLMSDLADGSRARSDLVRLGYFFVKLSIPSFACLLILNFYADELVANVFGRKWASAGVYITALFPGFLAMGFGVLIEKACMAYKKQNLIFINHVVIDFCFLAGFFLILTYFESLLGGLVVFSLGKIITRLSSYFSLIWAIKTDLVSPRAPG